MPDKPPDTEPAPAIRRNQDQAKLVAHKAYRFRGCVVCGLELDAVLQVAHLNHNPGDNDPDNLAWLCPTHHWMYDHGLYPVDAIKLLRAHWQETNGEPDHDKVMKDAGANAANLGRLGGAARARALTPEKRAEIAKKAATKRWAK